MEFVSTRDRDGKTYDFKHAVLQGIAEDGGLYFPAKLPSLSRDQIKGFDNFDYREIVKGITGLFVGDSIEKERFSRMVDDAYSANNFPERNADGVIMPLRETGYKSGIFIQGLSGGPTAAFKDHPLGLLSRKMDYFLEQEGDRRTCLGSSSGDTVSAAESAFKGAKNASVVMLTPLNGMSEFQKAQAGILSGGNIHNISVDGSFDVATDLVRTVNEDAEFKMEHRIGAVNSTNFGRLAGQVPYVFAGYFHTNNHSGVVDFAVPSGNFGNALSVYIAKEMGLPVGNIIAATGENDTLHKLIQTGIYEKRHVDPSSVPSMDISVASNFERLVFLLSGRDADLTSRVYDEFRKNGRVDLNKFGVGKNKLEEVGFKSIRTEHSQRIATIRGIYHGSGDVIDPHTAAGYIGGYEFEREDIPIVCFETALPVKFEGTIKDAIGEDDVPERSERFKDLESKVNGNAFTVLEPKPEALKKYISTHLN